MKEERTHVFRKSKGQIVIDGHVKLTDEEGNEIPHGDRFYPLWVWKITEATFL